MKAAMILDSAGTKRLHHSQKSRLGALGCGAGTLRGARRLLFGLKGFDNTVLHLSFGVTAADFCLSPGGAEVSLAGCGHVRGTDTGLTVRRAPAGG